MDIRACPYYSFWELCTPLPCWCTGDGTSRIHQDTPAVARGRMALHWFVEAALGTLWNEHVVFLGLFCLLQGWLKFLITWWCFWTEKKSIEEDRWKEPTWFVKEILYLFYVFLWLHIRIFFLKACYSSNTSSTGLSYISLESLVSFSCSCLIL